MDCGIGIHEFWELSVLEIFDMMESYYRVQRRKKKMLLDALFAAAKSTAERIGTYLDDRNKAQEIWDYYPDLFAEEKEAAEKTDRENDLEQVRHSRKAYAEEFNRRRGGK